MGQFIADMNMKVLVLCTLVGLATALHPLSDQFIAEINEKATTWTAGRNFHKDTPMGFIRGLLGARKTKTENPLPVLEMRSDEPTQDSFDARTTWPSCPSIGEIRDQSSCGSCWAISAAEVMTDRQCIHKNETFHYSADDIMSCCHECGDGCNGGDPYSAMAYWKTQGVVSGGQYNSKQGCRPYPFLSCMHHVTGPLPDCSKYEFHTPACKRSCVAGYDKSYQADRHFASKAYTVGRNEEAIKQEITQHGPVQAAFQVYSDFPNYKSGVYTHVSGQLLGGHAIRILGWGTENGTPYWLVANSWNTYWGDKGYFKIKRGSNECGIESGAVAGIPK